MGCKIADGGDSPPPFELHLDVDRAKKATLGVSPKTGGPIVRVMDGDGAGLVTLLPTDDAVVGGRERAAAPPLARSPGRPRRRRGRPLGDLPRPEAAPRRRRLRAARVRGQVAVLVDLAVLEVHDTQLWRGDGPRRRLGAWRRRRFAVVEQCGLGV